MVTIIPYWLTHVVSLQTFLGEVNGRDINMFFGEGCYKKSVFVVGEVGKVQRWAITN